MKKVKEIPPSERVCAVAGQGVVFELIGVVEKCYGRLDPFTNFKNGGTENEEGIQPNAPNIFSPFSVF